MLPCVCSVIDHRRRQNVVKPSVTRILEHLILDLFVYPVNVPHHIVYSDASEVACASYIYVEVEGFLLPTRIVMILKRSKAPLEGN